MDVHGLSAADQRQEQTDFPPSVLHPEPPVEDIGMGYSKIEKGVGPYHLRPATVNRPDWNSSTLASKKSL